MDPAIVTTVPLAAQDAFQPRSPGEQQRLRTDRDLHGDYVLYLGSNKPHKNLVRLVDAYATLRTQWPSTSAPLPALVIAGSWDDRYPEAKQRVAHYRLGNAVRFLGPLDDSDLPALYSAATAFIFPSRHEGFGLPVLEAMACGAPVACGRTSSLPEVAGDAAFYFDPANTESIAQAIRALVADGNLRRQLVRARPPPGQAVLVGTHRRQYTRHLPQPHAVSQRGKKPTMRILHIYKDYAPVVGGIENHIRTLSEGLQSCGVDARVLVTNTGPATVQETIDGVPVYKAGRLLNISSAPIAPDLFPALRRMEAAADIAHLHLPYPPGELGQLIFGRSRRTVLSYHSDIVRQRVMGALYSPFLRMILRRADRIAVASPAYIRSSPFLVPVADKCRVIPYGIDLRRFEASPDVAAAADALRTRYGRPLILFVGRLRHYKGVDVLLRAMHRLDAHLLIVGTGPMEHAWRTANGAPEPEWTK